MSTSIKQLIKSSLEYELENYVKLQQNLPNQKQIIDYLNSRIKELTIATSE